jgi:lipopolysaccharide transport system ATP-binding protein
MYARLAFAVATHVDPDILIIDEILAVGDEHFGRKSRAKMEEFKKAGRTIVLVTHDLGTVQQWCDEAAWLDGGIIRAAGAPHDVVAQYRQAVTLAEAQGTLLAPPAISPGGGALPSVVPPKPTHGPATTSDKRSGDFRVEIERVRLLVRGGREASSFDTEDPLEVVLDFVSNEHVPDVGFSVAVSDLDGTALYRTSTLIESFPLPSPLPPRGTVRLSIDRIGFTEGSYTVDVSAVTKAGAICDEQRGLYPLTIHSAVRDSGVARPPHRWRLDGAETESVPLARVAAS